MRPFSTTGALLQKAPENQFNSLFAKFASKGGETLQSLESKTPSASDELAALLRDTNIRSSRARPQVPDRGKVSNDVVDIDWSVLGGVTESELKRTGILASRSVLVEGAGGLQNALRRLNSSNGYNKIRRTVNMQRYHERPGKKKARLRLEKQQRQFDAEIRRLFRLVSEARRKGY